MSQKAKLFIEQPTTGVIESIIAAIIFSIPQIILMLFDHVLVKFLVVLINWSIFYMLLTALGHYQYGNNR